MIRSSEGVVVIDEAYAEFGAQNFLPRIRDFPNLIVLRTFSKVHGLAGLRVGYAAAPREIIERMNRVKIPFTVGALSEAIALEALRDDSFARHSRQVIGTERPWLADQLASLGLRVHPSDANFLLVRAPRELPRKLLEKGIAVRGMRSGTRLEDCFRVTVGRRDHNSALISAIRECLR